MPRCGPGVTPPTPGPFFWVAPFDTHEDATYARRAVLRLSATLPLVVSTALAAAALGPREAREAAQQFGRALTSAEPSAIRLLLPERGKVELDLDRLGPERGHFSAAQVEALLGDFLAEGAVQAFEVRRVECEGSLAVVHADAVLDDRLGRSARVAIHLSFRPESDRWVLRELREAPR